MIIKPPNKIISLIELRHLRPIELPHFVTTCPRVRAITQLHLNTTDKRAPPTERLGDSNDFNDDVLGSPLLCLFCAWDLSLFFLGSMLSTTLQFLSVMLSWLTIA